MITWGHKNGLSLFGGRSTQKFFDREAPEGQRQKRDTADGFVEEVLGAGFAKKGAFHGANVFVSIACFVNEILRQAGSEYQVKPSEVCGELVNGYLTHKRVKEGCIMYRANNDGQVGCGNWKINEAWMEHYLHNVSPTFPGYEALQKFTVTVVMPLSVPQQLMAEEKEAATDVEDGYDTDEVPDQKRAKTTNAKLKLLVSNLQSENRQLRAENQELKRMLQNGAGPQGVAAWVGQAPAAVEEEGPSLSQERCSGFSDFLATIVAPEANEVESGLNFAEMPPWQY